MLSILAVGATVVLLVWLWDSPFLWRRKLGPSGQAPGLANTSSARADGPPSAAPATTTTVTGIVQAGDRHLTGPLSGRRCVAFGLSGTGPSGVIHDSAFVPFVVVTQAGPLHVVGPRLRLAITPESRRVDAPVDGTFADFLASRGVPWTGATASLSEVVVAEGDVVEVTGQLTHVERPSTYRSHATTASLTSTDQTPLEVRSPAPLAE